MALRLKEVRQLVQDHTTRRWGTGLNLHMPSSTARIPTQGLCCFSDSAKESQAVSSRRKRAGRLVPIPPTEQERQSLNVNQPGVLGRLVSTADPMTFSVSTWKGWELPEMHLLTCLPWRADCEEDDFIL